VPAQLCKGMGVQAEQTLGGSEGCRARGGRTTSSEGDDTLTESCEGAVNFMVIEIRVGSLQELPVVVL